MVTISGVQSVLHKVQRYTDIDTKVQEIMKRLCEIGEPIINQVHGNHSTVTTEPTQNGYKITASGQDVLFIEFGAGDAAGRDAGLYDQVPKSVRPGSWSEKHAQMYSRYGFWVFGGHIMREVPPSPALYYAYEAMVQALPQIARDVFK